MRSGLKVSWLARASWLLLAGVSLGLVLLMVPINTRTIHSNWQIVESYPAIADFVGLQTYVNYWMVLNYAVAAICYLIAGLIAWRRSAELVPWLAAVMLALVPSAFSLGGYSETWWYYPQPWRELFRSVREFLTWAGGLTSMIAFIFLFPNSRSAPRWTLPLLGVVLAVTVAASVGLMLGFGADPFGVWFVSFMVALLLGVGVQVHRYLRVSSPLERQQTKWVVAGLIALIASLVGVTGLTIVAENSPYSAFMQLISIHSQALLLAFFPLALAFSILRYRLWDIDLLIRRSLLYAVLTTALAGLYLGSVIVLQSMLSAVTDQAPPQVVTVGSTLVIAAAAGPLRMRVQSAIDRRFNRRRYDAACTLEAFSAAMRGGSVADLDGLNRQLIGVVQETLEPEKVTLWLRS